MVIMFKNDCLTCKSVTGQAPLFPESRIFDGKYWLIEHALPPVGILGWFVIVLKRHCEALHELDLEELRELTDLQFKLYRTLRQKLDCEKEYTMCFAENPAFNHIHYHVVAKPVDLDEKYRGANIFKLLSKEVENPIERERIVELCERMVLDFSG